MKFENNQFTITTAEEENNSFSGKEQYNYKIDNDSKVLPSGQYRIIDGELSQIVGGLNLENLQKKLSQGEHSD